MSGAVDVIAGLDDELRGLVEMYRCHRKSPHVLKLKGIRDRIDELLAAVVEALDGDDLPGGIQYRLQRAYDACRPAPDSSHAHAEEKGR
jgi:hypothetical protein